MNRTIEELCETMHRYARKWHGAGLALFEFSEQLKGVDHPVVSLLYHNYQIWHFIELYTSPDSGTVLFVYDGGIRHNKLRNDCIEQIDGFLCERQRGSGKVNSETIGSILDRIGILQIKVLHLADKGDPRLSLVKRQLDTLVRCAGELMDDMIAGERRCEVFSRFKIEYSGQ
jgi:hypothetical protein